MAHTFCFTVVYFWPRGTLHVGRLYILLNWGNVLIPEKEIDSIELGFEG
jgi:hypothetical protein